jgi:hypothetical protein
VRKTTLALALLAVVPAGSQAQSPTWQTDYAAALTQSATMQRPLAIVFGNGPNGWQQLSGRLNDEAGRLLADEYVCCYIDTATSRGEALFRRFELNTSVALVLGDRTGTQQVFWHEGPLAANTLAAHLSKYAGTGPIPVSFGTPSAAVAPSSVPVTGYFSAPSAPFAGGGHCRG